MLGAKTTSAFTFIVVLVIFGGLAAWVAVYGSEDNPPPSDQYTTIYQDCVDMAVEQTGEPRETFVEACQCSAHNIVDTLEQREVWEIAGGFGTPDAEFLAAELTYRCFLRYVPEFFPEEGSPRQ